MVIPGLGRTWTDLITIPLFTGVIGYLTNLNRQGLIDFSKEKVADPGRYQLIEVQPSVTAARAQAGWAPRLVYRSIRLATFGRGFCQDCLPPGAGAGPVPAAPGPDRC